MVKCAIILLLHIMYAYIEFFLFLRDVAKADLEQATFHFHLFQKVFLKNLFP